MKEKLKLRKLLRVTMNGAPFLFYNDLLYVRISDIVGVTRALDREKTILWLRNHQVVELECVLQEVAGALAGKSVPVKENGLL